MLSRPLSGKEILRYLTHSLIILDSVARYPITGRAIFNMEQLYRDVLGDGVARESRGVFSYQTPNTSAITALVLVTQVSAELIGSAPRCP